MKTKLLQWLKGLLIVILWILAGVLILAIFTGTLWITEGSLSGYPALIVATLAAIIISRFAVNRSSSNLGKILRLTPTTIFLMIVFWSIIPMASDELISFPDDPNLEMWDLGDERMVSISHHQPTDDADSREEAIIFVHGGPGAYVRDFDRNFAASFSKDGYHVFVYDQVGAGRSGIIDVQDYSHSGNVADLHKIIQKIDRPIILIGQSYGAGLISSYMDVNRNDHNVRSIILTEPGPLPGAFPQSGPFYDEKTTRAENFDGPGILEAISSPRFLFGMILPIGNEFISQQEMMNSITPELQAKIVATSFCKKSGETILEFKKLRVNPLASRNIRSSFMAEKTPDLTNINISVLLLLGECSYLPRGYAMDYFEANSINRSHWIPDVGHIIWGTENGQRLTREAILSFLDDTELPLPNEPVY